MDNGIRVYASEQFVEDKITLESKAMISVVSNIIDKEVTDRNNAIQSAIDNEVETRNIAISTAKDEAKTYTDEKVTALLGSFTSDIEPAEDDLPTVFINGTIPDTKVDQLAELIYISKTETFHAYITIKCQGTSSLNYPKKNFTVKLFEDESRSVKLKKNFKGWGNQNKFCLKANWMDISHARNIVSARIWGDIVKTRQDYDSLPEELRTSPNQGAVDGFPIRVFCNGIYWGRYTWNIPKDGWMSNMDSNLDTHCILCGENYESGCFRALANINRDDWTDELHDVAPESIITSWNNAINFVMNSTDQEFKTNIENYFNLSSLIDYYLFSYAICHLDGLGKNQLFFTYDGIHWLASAYDLDSTFGLYWDGNSFVSETYKMPEDYEPTRAHGTSNLLYDRLATLFKARIKDRWNELYSGILNPMNVIKYLEDFTNVCPPHIIEEDYASTTGYGGFGNIPSTTTNNIGQLRNYAVRRLSYTDSMINLLDGELIFKEDYTPNGTTWVDSTNINFEKGDYIEISIDTSTISPGSGLENIISIGDSISGWYQKIGGYHLYYEAGTNSGIVEVNCFENMMHVSRDRIAVTESTLLIKIDKFGIYINGDLITTNYALPYVTKVQIGSVEGAIRSNATYNYIKVVGI